MRALFRRHVSLFAAFVFPWPRVVACLMPVHNDTWWHLRTGYETLRDHAPLFTDRFSFTAYGNFFWNHSWGAQVLFYLLFSVGGFPLLTTFCAALTLAAWALVWRQMRGPLDLRLIVFALACSASTTIWSVRPQVFSILLLPLVATLAARDGGWAIPPLVILWANLHAGVAIGVVVVAASVVAALLRDRDRLLPRGLCLIATGAATLSHAVGTPNWTETAASMARSSANQIQEWQPTPLRAGTDGVLGAGRALSGSSCGTGGDCTTPADRMVAAAALLVLPLAVRTLRNVPAFMMLAAPALTSTDMAPRPTRANIWPTVIVPLRRLVSGCVVATRCPRLPGRRQGSSGARGAHLGRCLGGARSRHRRQPRSARVKGPALQHLSRWRSADLVCPGATGLHRQPAGSVSNSSHSGCESGGSHGRLSGSVHAVGYQLCRAAAAFSHRRRSQSGRVAPEVSRHLLGGP